MDRPDLLSPPEQQIVDAHRTALQQTKTASAALSPDVKKELASIYEDLVYTAPELLPERAQEIGQRLYSLLY